MKKVTIINKVDSNDESIREISEFEQREMVLFYSQISIDSLRDIEIPRRQHKAKWFHLGFKIEFRR